METRGWSQSVIHISSKLLKISGKACPAMAPPAGSQMLDGMRAALFVLTQGKRSDEVLREYCQRIARREESVAELIAARKQ